MANGEIRMTKRRVKLLVSVRDVAEAEAALTGGADIIDIKEPLRGPMGQADVATISAIIEFVNGRRPVTAALGELTEHLDSSAVTFKRALSYIKIALAHAPADWSEHLLRLFSKDALPKLIVVAYADHREVGAPEPENVLRWVCHHQAAGMLIDTAVKDGHGFFDHLDSGRAQQLVQQCRSMGGLIALAGALKDEAFEKALKLKPDIVGVRTAACVGHDRQAHIHRDLVEELASLISFVAF